MDLAAHLAAQKKAAWDARDLDLYMSYDRFERELRGLRTVGHVAVLVYSDSRNGDYWQALFEALSDAGLLDAPAT